ncbi:copper amine oxidase N-terminal domain-containing protein [Paenibacillus pinistramenti]|uniref:copper amine oxidase N-terminal domain-containing protein n=1 Tax=Paenibacillus pinistramenti TaxID=1768003 RepID=UPI001109A289|nr:copper amine oxidase N-terminal domain-containing protein [Paenibacillus pinistramenti]
MKKACLSVLFASVLFLSSTSVYAASSPSIKVDGTAVVTDVKPEIKNNRMMVPLRTVSENLGAQVVWSGSEVTLIKDDMKVTLQAGSSSAVQNGKTVKLDAKPYVKNNRFFVPLRFIAETFGCEVGYSGSAVTIDSEPFLIGGVPVKALQQEYHMTMGGIVQQIGGTAYNEAIYNLIVNNKGDKTDAPASYSWMFNIDVPGSYYKNAQYDFLDEKGDSIKQYDIYSLVEAFPAEELEGYPKVLLYDASEQQWYLFSTAARDSINSIIEKAALNGFLKIISNTVV